MLLSSPVLNYYEKNPPNGTFRNVPLLLSHACPCAGWFDAYTQPATDREKRLTEGISHSVSRRFSVPCLQTLSFSGNFRFHFYYHLCQQFFALFLTVSVDVPGALFAIGPDRRVAAFPELLVDLGAASGPLLTPLAFMGLECTGSRIPRC